MYLLKADLWKQYKWSYISVDSTSMDSINCGFENIWKKGSIKFQKSKTWICNYLHSIHIVYQSTLVMIWSIWENVHTLFANTIPFHIKDSRICGFGYLEGLEVVLEPELLGFCRAFVLSFLGSASLQHANHILHKKSLSFKRRLQPFMLWTIFYLIFASKSYFLKIKKVISSSC